VHGKHLSHSRIAAPPLILFAPAVPFKCRVPRSPARPRTNITRYGGLKVLKLIRALGASLGQMGIVDLVDGGGDNCMVEGG
jgi:hypothetical protein